MSVGPSRNVHHARSANFPAKQRNFYDKFLCFSACFRRRIRFSRDVGRENPCSSRPDFLRNGSSMSWNSFLASSLISMLMAGLNLRACTLPKISSPSATHGTSFLAGTRAQPRGESQSSHSGSDARKIPLHTTRHTADNNVEWVQALEFSESSNRTSLASFPWTVPLRVFGDFSRLALPRGWTGSDSLGVVLRIRVP